MRQALGKEAAEVDERDEDCGIEYDVPGARNVGGDGGGVPVSGRGQPSSIGALALVFLVNRAGAMDWAIAGAGGQPFLGDDSHAHVFLVNLGILLRNDGILAIALLFFNRVGCRFSGFDRLVRPVRRAATN